MGSHGREAGSTGRWSNVRGKGGLHKSSCWGVVGSLSLEEKEARKAEELGIIYHDSSSWKSQTTDWDPDYILDYLAGKKSLSGFLGTKRGERYHLIAPGASQPKQLRDQIRPIRNIPKANR